MLRKKIPYECRYIYRFKDLLDKLMSLHLILGIFLGKLILDMLARVESLGSNISYLHSYVGYLPVWLKLCFNKHQI